jgi:hypothetical protein
MSEHEARYHSGPVPQWRDGYPAAGRRQSSGMSPGWLTTGLVVVGLGLLAWYYLGPDLQRYMKIRNM